MNTVLSMAQCEARNSNANNHHVGRVWSGGTKTVQEIHNSYAVGNLDAGCHAGGFWSGSNSLLIATTPDNISTIKNSYAHIDISLAASGSCSPDSAKSGAGLVACEY